MNLPPPVLALVAGSAVAHAIAIGTEVDRVIEDDVTARGAEAVVVETEIDLLDMDPAIVEIEIEAVPAVTLAMTEMHLRRAPVGNCHSRRR
jgi:sulfur transfer complex TusBCD TusB component (DsrH family)